MTDPKWYDITLSRNKLKEMNLDGFEEVGRMFENLGAERYVIGREVGESGYEHYQCRIVFKHPTAITTLISAFAGLGNITATHVRDFKYCEKEGNFYRSWEKVLNKYADLKLLPWQKQVLDELEKQDDRKIMVVMDEKGGKGKTTLAKMCVTRRIATYVPPLTEAMDFMAFAMEKPSAGYLFDMPRSETIKQKKGMWSAVEQIKNGYLYDKRYSYRDMWIEPPKVLVFTNEEPPIEALSADRWEIYKIEHWAGTDVLTSWEPD